MSKIRRRLKWVSKLRDVTMEKQILRALISSLNSRRYDKVDTLVPYYTAYADGSFIKETGVGGWAIVCRKPDGRLLLRQSGSILAHNSVTPEIEAVLHAEEILPTDAPAVIITDCKYLEQMLKYPIMSRGREVYVRYEHTNFCRELIVVDALARLRAKGLSESTI